MGSARGRSITGSLVRVVVATSEGDGFLGRLVYVRDDLGHELGLFRGQALVNLSRDAHSVTFLSFLVLAVGSQRGLCLAVELDKRHTGAAGALEGAAGASSATQQQVVTDAAEPGQPDVVTGLLQAEGYAREVLRPGQKASELDRMLATRMARQEILGREEPPWVVVLLKETAVRKIVGNRATTKEQLAQLLKLMEEPHINVLVVPTHAAVYPSGGFTLFSREDEPDIGYVEGAAIGGRVVELGSQVDKLRRLWDMIGTVAMTEEATKGLIREVMESL